MPPFAWTLLVTTAMAIACATLSVFVVSRRWAFIGEGISHSGFGGAGTVWLLGLAIPSIDRPELSWAPYGGVVAFCFLTAAGIGYVTRERPDKAVQTEADTAIGIFMVASLAWGFIAQSIYRSHHNGTNPRGWDTFLFGDPAGIGVGFAIAATLTCAGVVAVVALLGKEILAYCIDPTTAEASGVRTGAIHYLLILLVTLTIVIGARIVGTVLVTALLVLPGATAQAISRRLRSAVTVSIATGAAGAVAGLLASRQWPVLPVGPAIVLALFLVFCGTYVAARLRGR